MYHKAIMVEECIQGLEIKPNGIYVDCTFGGGGHSLAILNKLNEQGKLFAFDQDESVINNLIDDKRFFFFPHNFCYLKNFLKLKGILKVDGIIADLGVSSHQIDEPNRGFSIKNDEIFLDMRMDVRKKTNAIEILNNYSQENLANVFFLYGDLLNSRQLAKSIVEYRIIKPINTLKDLKIAIQKNIKGIEQKYLTKLFQALRIEVNEELEMLKKMLLQTTNVLNKDGKLVVLSFHSLEDRIVKKFMKNESWYNDEKNEIIYWKMLTKKPIEANINEIKINKRSQSAKLRIAKKII